MSAILEQLIIDRKKGVIKYAELLDAYVELAKNATKPEDNTRYLLFHIRHREHKSCSLQISLPASEFGRVVLQS